MYPVPRVGAAGIVKQRIRSDCRSNWARFRISDSEKFCRTCCKKAKNQKAKQTIMHCTRAMPRINWVLNS